MKREFLNKQITESMAEDAARAEQDHEVQMARADCFYAAKDAIELHKILTGISEQQGLPGWVASKITLASDYLKSVKEYLEYQQMGQQEEVQTEPELEFVDETTSAGGIATSMGGGNGFVNGGPGTVKRFKKRVSEGLPSIGANYSTGSQGVGNNANAGSDDDGEAIANALKKAGNANLANKLKTGTTFNKDELAAIIAAKG